MPKTLNRKQLIEVFIFCFVISFIVINWSSISWLFNYRELSGLVSDFFNPYPDTASALVAPNKTAADIVKIRSIIYPYSSKDNTLEIPSIGVNTPVVVAESADKKALARDLDNGAVYYPGSVPPGQDGQMVILGHSAPPNWPKIKHDYIFSNLQNLNKDDQIILTFNNKQYTYKVIDTTIIQKGQDVSSQNTSSNILTLISCWPPGKDYQRIAVTAELIEI